MKQLVVNTINKLLAATMPESAANVAHNRVLWNRYARYWTAMRGRMPLDNPAVTKDERATYLKILGDEWGRPSDIETVLARYINPYVDKTSLVGEIGTGGGRMACKVAPRVDHFYCFDISKEMLKKVRAALGTDNRVTYVLLDETRLPDELNGTLDFIYAFDVFVHLDLHTMWKYFQEMARVLKLGGKAFVHTANLLAPDGWKRFASQDQYSVLGHYFVSPDIVVAMANRSGLQVIKTSFPLQEEQEDNFYVRRDFLAVLEKQVSESVPT